MSTSPKFRITIQGIASGVPAGRVRLALGKKFALLPSEVDQLLANQAGPLTGLMEHQDAWVLRNELQHLGVDCRIAPVPRSHLQGNENRMTLQGTDPHRHIGHAPRVRRTPHRALAMRSGRMMPERKRAPALLSGLRVPPLLRAVVVVALAVAVGFSLQSVRDRPSSAVAVADSAR